MGNQTGLDSLSSGLSMEVLEKISADIWKEMQEKYTEHQSQTGLTDATGWRLGAAQSGATSQETFAARKFALEKKDEMQIIDRAEKADLIAMRQFPPPDHFHDGADSNGYTSQQSGRLRELARQEFLNQLTDLSDQAELRRWRDIISGLRHQDRKCGA